MKEKRFINDLISHITQKQIMKRTILSLVAVALATVTMTAQEALWSGTQVQSPVVNVDGTVTFSIFAPQAQKVQSQPARPQVKNPTQQPQKKEVLGIQDIRKKWQTKK